MEFRDRILGFLAHGDCVQIVAPAGFGKSRFGRNLGVVYLDFNLVLNKTPETLADFVKENFVEGIIVLDSLDSILDIKYLPFFNYLKALRDQHKYRLAYVFLTSKAVTHEALPIMGDLYELATEHVEYLPTLTRAEYDTFGLTGFTANSKQALEIEKLSGGISSLVKIYMLAMRDRTSLDPNVNLKLKGQIEEMLATNPSHPAYAKASLVQDYLNSKPGEFTAAESRLYELLKSKSGQIVSKDEIARTVYPDVKNYNGVSDHALDQLIHRLRSKISHLGSRISTHRGLGYELT